jgi:virginiamycin A acetyltransferase
MKIVLKRTVQALFLMLTFPPAAACAFGRFHHVFSIFAHTCALVPGLVGDYVRAALYHWTLMSFPINSRIEFGSFICHPETSVAEGVYIGAYCVLGNATIGERTQIASHVQILSGAHQHARGPDGKMLGSEAGVFRKMVIGADCWLGAGAIIMADVGEGSTVGAGAVVTRSVPPRVVVAGNPARVIRADVSGN